MFNLFKRTKVEAWERQLLINIFSHLPTGFHYLKEQVEEGILKRIPFLSTVIPNYVGFRYNIAVVNKFERRQDNGFNITGIKVYDGLYQF